MAIELIIDNRSDPSHIIRAKSDRRLNKVRYHLLKWPFKDCVGLWILRDRRSGFDRRKKV
jgi:hypothetical protein